MLVQEIIEPKYKMPNFDIRKNNRRQISPQDLDIVSQYFKNKDYKYIAGGSYSLVFEYTPTSVIKVFSPRDKAYVKFYSLSKRTNNPHFPIISKMGYIDIPFDEDGNYYRAFSVIIEKLKQLPTTYFDLIKFIYDYYNDKEENDKWFIKYPKLKEALDLIFNLNETVDITQSNIMMRGEIPVFIDPIAPRIR